MRGAGSHKPLVVSDLDKVENLLVSILDTEKFVTGMTIRSLF